MTREGGDAACGLSMSVRDVKRVEVAVDVKKLSKTESTTTIIPKQTDVELMCCEYTSKRSPLSTSQIRIGTF